MEEAANDRYSSKSRAHREMSESNWKPQPASDSIASYGPAIDAAVAAFIAAILGGAGK